MKTTITNLGTVDLPIASSDNGGFVTTLKPGMPYTVDDTKIVTATIGDNPPFLEDLQKSLSGVAKKVKELVMFWRHAQPEPHGGAPAPAAVQVRLVCLDAGGLRVLQGDDRDLDHDMVMSETFEAKASNYVELRQLGNAPQQGGTPD